MILNNKIHKNLLIGLYFTIICLLIIGPINVHAVTNSTTISPGYYFYTRLLGSSGSFSASDTIDAFIADQSGIDYYHQHASIPSSALWDTTSSSGSFSGINALASTLYLVFGNMHSTSTVTVSYTINVAIPGFEHLFALLAIVGFSIIFLLINRKRFIK